MDDFSFLNPQWPALKLLKQIWEVTSFLAVRGVTIYYGFGSFDEFWWLLTHAPSVPFISQQPMYNEGKCIIILFTQFCSFVLMWKAFQNAQAKIQLPRNKVDIRYILQLLPEWGPMSGLHFVYSRFGWRRRAPSTTPWNLKHALIITDAATVSFFIAKLTGLLGLVVVSLYLIIWDTCHLTMRQARAAFGHFQPKVPPILDYRHKALFAYASIFQAAGFMLLPCLSIIDGLGWFIYVLFALPITSVATLLLYLTYGQEPDYSSDPIPVDTVRTSKGPKLCGTCQSTIVSHPSPNGVHHQTSSELQKSALGGCRVCTAVWERRSRIPRHFVSLLMYWKPVTTYNRTGCGLSISYGHGTQTRDNCEFQLETRQVADVTSSNRLDLRKRIALADLPNHTGSDQSLGLALKWLQHCTIYHGTCCANHDETFRPSRLLYIANDSICIYTTHDMPRRVRYLTLSHCWGKSHIIRLLESNVDTFRQNILFSSLPKTFQDAVRVTRHLGVSYLWIDSLCIIQDSTADWNHEAVLMGKIYKNAACNIAASDAPGSQHGCLYPRDPRALQPDAVYFRPHKEETYIINKTDIYEDHILYTRAWVLQEALLAPRTLDCGRGQLFWRCAEMRASEVFPGGVPTSIYFEDHPAAKFKCISAGHDQVILNANVIERFLRSDKTKLQVPIAPGKGSLERYTDSPFAFWAKIVEDYTMMDLTLDKDRIVALAGITDVFRPYFGEHSFGTWRIFMPLELLWTGGYNSRRPSTLRAPTWSWMSLEGPVSYDKCHFKYRRDTLVTQFIGIEALDERRTALRLSTPLMRATWTSRSETGRYCHISSIEGERQTVSLWGVLEFSNNFCKVHLDHWDEDIPVEIFCMIIQIRNVPNQGEVIGLALREIEDGVFERLGYFSDFRGQILYILEGIQRREIILT